jgi:electron transfer flavoprotein alpha subunit
VADVIWVYAEISDEKITTTSLEMLAKAAEVGKAEAILLGPAPDEAVQALARHGASRIYRCADAVYQDYLTLPAADTVAGLIQKHSPAVLLCASSYAGRDLVANLSARLDCGAIADVGDFQLKDGAIEATIPALGASYQNTSTLVSPGTKLLLVRPKSFEPKVSEQPLAIEEVGAPADESLRIVHMKERVAVKREGPQLEGAKVIVSGGRGVKGEDNFAMLTELANVLGGVGARLYRAAHGLRFQSRANTYGRSCGQACAVGQRPGFHGRPGRCIRHWTVSAGGQRRQTASGP